MRNVSLQSKITNYGIADKEVLKRKGISVKELSQLLGVTRDACYKYINGNPTINVLDRIAKVLDVDVRSLINGRDGKEFRASNDIMGKA